MMLLQAQGGRWPLSYYVDARHGSELDADVVAGKQHEMLFGKLQGEAEDLTAKIRHLQAAKHNLEQKLLQIKGIIFIKSDRFRAGTFLDLRSFGKWVVVAGIFAEVSASNFSNSALLQLYK